MLKKIYQKEGNIIILSSLDIKLVFYIIQNLKKEKNTINDYKKDYYQSIGFIYPSHQKGSHLH